MKLISMKDFVLEQCKLFSTYQIDYRDCLLRIENYANFLNQPLTLGMFVPCDLDGKVLTNPIDDKDWSNWTNEERSKICDNCEQAKERVLFEFIGKDPIGRKSKGLFFRGTVFFKIEDLTIFNDFTLTPTAIEQIGI